MTQATQPQIAIFKVQQAATAAGGAVHRNLFFRCGFRPSVIKVYRNGADSGADFMWFDNISDPNEVLRRSTATLTKDQDYQAAASPAAAPQGITVTDDGFWMGQSDLFVVDEAHFCVMVYGTGYDAELVTLNSSLPVYDPEEGNADQYDAQINADGSGSARGEFSDYGVFQSGS